MGYSADLLAGDPIRIPKTNAGQAVELFQDKEQNPTDPYIRGHISWCHPISDYVQTLAGGDSAVVAQLLEDYGFIVSQTDTHIVLDTWGGDKLGSSWDDVWNVLADITDNDVRWLMVGEDQELWAEVIDTTTRERLSRAITGDDLSVLLESVVAR